MNARIAAALFPAFFLLMLLVSTGLAAQVLENESVLIEVASDRGAIVRLLDRRSGTEFITAPGNARLFQLMLDPVGERTRRILSWQQSARIEQSGPGELAIHFDRLQPEEEQYLFGSGVMHFDEPVLDLAGTVRLRLDGDHLRAHLQLRNASGERVVGVIFPQLGGMPLASEAGPARIVLPSLSQRTFTHTLAVFTGERANRYPAMVAAPWLNYELGAASFGIEARGSLEAQDALFALNPGHFEEGSAYRGRYEFPLLAWISWPHLATGAEWSSPEVVIHVHGGDWHQLAGEHRESRRAQQVSTAKTKWQGHIGFASYRLKHDDNTIVWRYSDLEGLAQHAQSAGIDRLVIEGWREREGSSNPAPRGEVADPRLGGADGLRRAIGQLEERGVELIFAFHPTLINVFADAYPSPDEAWTVRSRRGSAQIPVDFLMASLDYPVRPFVHRYRMEIDPATSATDFLLGEAGRLVSEYGIRNLLLKGVGQRAFVSYQTTNGVAPQDAYRIGIARLLGGVRQQIATGILLTEGFNDLVNPYADGAYTWDQTHDPAILPYSIPWHPLSNDVEALDYRAANLSFAHQALINLIVDDGRGTVARYPGFAAHLGALRKLKAATRAYYAEAEFRDRDGLREVSVSGEAVVTVFRQPSSGVTGIVLANLAAAPASVSFGLESSLAAGQGRLHRLGQTATETVSTAERVAANLGPYEVAILAIANQFAGR